MTDKKYAEFIAVANHCLRGNQAAVNFMLLICDILHVWDDLIDRDKPANNDDIHRAFYGALVRLPRDPFYSANFLLLNPILEMAILNWQAANEMEAVGDEAGLRIAFILRSTYADLATMCARIVGGELWARQKGGEIRRHWHDEGWDGYLSNLANEKKVRAEQ
ncbi:hypothetical protein [Telmatospirillum sp.]|uniref:hypothetical protein n=1 Tax=Telmatospirillum sp. TaxID=2079197 RepID=UPI002842491A|nr:hypothetical protein [Telmatospirillum sp.]MDR3439882.1 hypothetical protein [Telmatospirillum sp.]